MSEHAATPTQTHSATDPVTPAIVLGWIAANPEQAWFPFQHAQKTGLSRETLHEPLAALRLAGLIRVSDWVKGFGQGYAVTPEGAKFVGDPAGLNKLLANPNQAQPVLEPIRTTFDRGEEVRQAIIAPRPPVVSQALMFACVLWFAVGLVLAIVRGRSGNAYLASGDSLLLEQIGAVSGLSILRGEWWRLLTSCFVHIGLIHLLLNMYALGSIGSVTESIWGRKRFLLLYLASGFGGSCFAMGFKPESLTAGASGAIWGLMTSLGAWLWVNRVHLPPTHVKQGLQQLGVLLSINILVSFMPGVSWAGHFGGGFVGLLVAAIFAYGWRWGAAGRWVALSLTLVLIAGCGLWLRWYTQHGERWITMRALQTIASQIRIANRVQIPLHTIDLPILQRLAQDVQVALLTKVKRKNLSEDIEKLQVDAMAIRAENFPTDERTKAAIKLYAGSVVDFARTLQVALRNPNADVEAIKRELVTLSQHRIAIVAGPKP